MHQLNYINNCYTNKLINMSEFDWIPPIRVKMNAKELITLVKCWVKAKYVVKVQKEIAAIEKKYNCS